MLVNNSSLPIILQDSKPFLTQEKQKPKTTTMRSTFAAIILALGISSFAAAGPIERRDVHCGTTSDATLSDCQVLTSDKAVWDAAWAGSSNVCHFTNPLANLYDHEAYNVACHGVSSKKKINLPPRRLPRIMLTKIFFK